MEQNYYHLCDKQYDAEFDRIELLKRYPWVGINYADSKCRILLLGESHYATDNREFSKEEYDNFKNNKDSTRGIIRTVMNNYDTGEQTYKFFDGLLKTFITTTPENVKEFWSKVAFYNFIQEPMGKSNMKPSDQQKEDGWRCLVEVARVLQPKYIILFGQRNWYGLEKLGFGCLTWEGKRIDGCEPAMGKITCPNKEIPLAIIKHSSRASSKVWRDYLQEKTPEVMSFFVDGNQ